MGIGVSIFLIAVGAILAFAVNFDVSGLDITVVGYILMIVGVIGLIMTAFIWGPRNRTRAAATWSRSAGSTTTASEHLHERLAGRRPSTSGRRPRCVRRGEPCALGHLATRSAGPRSAPPSLLMAVGGVLAFGVQAPAERGEVRRPARPRPDPGLGRRPAAGHAGRHAPAASAAAPAPLGVRRPHRPVVRQRRAPARVRRRDPQRCPPSAAAADGLSRRRRDRGRTFDGWYADMDRSPVKDEIQQRHLGLPPTLLSTSLVTWDGIAEIVEALRLRPGDTLLDLACGRGGYGLEVADRTGARWSASTSPPRPCGRRRSTPPGWAGPPTSGSATWSATGLDAGSVQAVLCIDAVQFAVPPEAAYAELRRVLAPGGRAVLTCWEALEPRRRRLPDRLRAVDLGAGLTAAGFVDVDVHEKPAWDAVEHAMWTEAAALDPAGEPALQSFHDEGVAVAAATTSAAASRRSTVGRRRPTAMGSGSAGEVEAELGGGAVDEADRDAPVLLVHVAGGELGCRRRRRTPPSPRRAARRRRRARRAPARRVRPSPRPSPSRSSPGGVAETTSRVAGPSRSSSFCPAGGVNTTSSSTAPGRAPRSPGGASAARRRRRPAPRRAAAAGSAGARPTPRPPGRRRRTTASLGSASPVSRVRDRRRWPGRTGVPRRCRCRATATEPSGSAVTPSGCCSSACRRRPVDVAEVEQPGADRGRDRAVRRGSAATTSRRRPARAGRRRPRARTAGRTTRRRPARRAAPRSSCRRSTATAPVRGSKDHSWWMPAIATTTRPSYQATSQGEDRSRACRTPCIHCRPVPATVVTVAVVEPDAAQRVVDRVGDHDVVARPRRARRPAAGSRPCGSLNRAASAGRRRPGRARPSRSGAAPSRRRRPARPASGGRSRRPAGCRRAARAPCRGSAARWRAAAARRTGRRRGAACPSPRARRPARRAAARARAACPSPDSCATT